MNGLNISRDKLDMLGKISVMAENLTGAFSLRVDGSPYAKGSSANVTISAKKDLPGIDIRVKDGTVGEKIHIPVRIWSTTTFISAKTATSRSSPAAAFTITDTRIPRTTAFIPSTSARIRACSIPRSTTARTPPAAVKTS